MTCDGSITQWVPVFMAGIFAGVMLFFAALVTAYWTSGAWKREQQEERYDWRLALRRDRIQIAQWVRGFLHESCWFNIVHEDGTTVDKVPLSQVASASIVRYIAQELENEANLPKADKP